jgi:cysteine desulfurase/selenocysteine lyase
MNLDQIRADFPILNQKIHGQRLAYLDNAATSQKPQIVIDAVADYYRRDNSNVHRAIHHLAEQSTEAYESARKTVASFLNAGPVESIIFTRGTTEGINLLAHSLAGTFSPGDEILLTEMEHHSNLVPWQMASQRTGAVLKYIPVLDDGTLDMEAYRALLSSRTRLVTFTQISNVLGTVNPAKQIVALAHAAGAQTLVDAAQSVPHIPVDVQDLDTDFLVFSGHKVCGPTGIGVLYGKLDLLNSLPPFLGGGEMIQKVEWQESTYAAAPARFEAGTPNMAGAIGMAAALKYVSEIGMSDIHAHVEDLTAQALKALQGIMGLTLYGPMKGRSGAVTFSLEGIHPHDLGQYIDRQGVAIRGGHMCCQPLLHKLGHNALNRASFYFYNTADDIAQLVEGITKAKDFFGRI